MMNEEIEEIVTRVKVYTDILESFCYSCIWNIVEPSMFGYGDFFLEWFKMDNASTTLICKPIAHVSTRENVSSV